MHGTIREARLRPEYATLYPAIQADVWMPAAAIGQQLLLWHLTAPATPPGERLMAEEHFEFRGGQSGSAPGSTCARAWSTDDPQLTRWVPIITGTRTGSSVTVCM